MKNPDSKEGIGTDRAMEEAIKRRCREGVLGCEAAMEIADKLSQSPVAVGALLDRMGVRLGKCGLGLLGCIHPENRKVQTAAAVSPELEEEIRSALRGGCLPCSAAWLIAEDKKIAGMDVSAACEFLKIRIKPCRFGIF